MPNDPIETRYAKNLNRRKLDDIAKRARSKEDLEAEKKILEETKKVDPIQAQDHPGRNSPCPCGSGKKYKKCCGKDSQ